MFIYLYINRFTEFHKYNKIPITMNNSCYLLSNLYYETTVPTYFECYIRIFGWCDEFNLEFCFIREKTLFLAKLVNQ